MKKLLVSNLSLALLLLVSTSALAHTGHLSNEPVHSFLHVEHIIILAAFALIIYVFKTINKK